MILIFLSSSVSINSAFCPSITLIRLSLIVSSIAFYLSKVIGFRDPLRLYALSLRMKG